MKLRQFQTNFRLWLGISLVLFCASGFLPEFSIKSPDFCWLQGLCYAFESLWNRDYNEFYGLLVMMGIGISFFFVVALVLGWILQGVVLVLLNRTSGKSSDH